MVLIQVSHKGQTCLYTVETIVKRIRDRLRLPESAPDDAARGGVLELVNRLG